jgi:WD40 repeat protein
VTFSPDGKRLASGSSDLTVRVWHTEARDAAVQTFTLVGHRQAVRDVAFSPKGFLASASDDRTVKIWRWGTGQEIRTLRGHRGPVGKVTYSPDGGQLISAGSDSTVKTWDTQSGRNPASRRLHLGPVTALGISPDGKRLWTVGLSNPANNPPVATGRELRFWDIDPLRFKGTRALGSVLDVGWTSDGARIVQPATKGVRILAVRESGGSEARTLPFVTTPSALAISLDGKSVAALGRSIDAEKKPPQVTYVITAWDMATGKERFVYQSPQITSSIRFSPDGKYLSVVGGYRDQEKEALKAKVTILDAASGAEIITVKGTNSLAISWAYSPDSRRFAAAHPDQDTQKSVVTVWDTATGKEVCIFRGHECQVGEIAFSPDARTIATAGGAFSWSPGPIELKLWDATTGEETANLPGHEGGTHALAFSPDGKRLVSAGEDRTVKLWDSATGTGLLTLRGHTAAVHWVLFSPDGHRLVSVDSQGNLMIWDGRPWEGKAAADTVPAIEGENIPD